MTNEDQLRFTAAINANMPIAISAWIASIAATIARPRMADDATDIALLAVHLTFALAAIALAILTPRRVGLFIALTLGAATYGAYYSPAILWKLQLPVAMAIWLAAEASKYLYRATDTAGEITTIQLKPLPRGGATRRITDPNRSKLPPR